VLDCLDSCAEGAVVDCVVFQFFTKKKVPKVLSSEELFKSITGHNYDDKTGLMELQQSFKVKPHLVDKLEESDHDFEKQWEKAQKELEMATLAEPPLA
jgi:hypothetical protein